MKRFDEDLREKLNFDEMKNELMAAHFSYKLIWQIAVLVLEESFQRSPRVWLQIGPKSKLRLIWVSSSPIEDA